MSQLGFSEVLKWLDQRCEHEDVEVDIFGTSRDALDVIHVAGTLHRVLHVDQSIHEEISAVVYRISDSAEIALYPQRFVMARASPERGELEVRTRDATIFVGRKSRAWID